MKRTQDQRRTKSREVNINILYCTYCCTVRKDRREEGKDGRTEDPFLELQSTTVSQWKMVLHRSVAYLIIITIAIAHHIMVIKC
jgi:hypothetical protein